MRRLLPAMAIIGSLAALQLSIDTAKATPSGQRPADGSGSVSVATPAPAKPPLRLDIDPLALLTPPTDVAGVPSNSPALYPPVDKGAPAKGIGPMLREADRPAIDASRGDFFANHQIGIQFKSGF